METEPPNSTIPTTATATWTTSSSAAAAPPSRRPPPCTYTSPAPELITQGAEALLYRTYFLQTSCPAALKYRPSKPYRHPILDKRLTKHRILSEARTLVKCRREGVNVPGVLALDAEGAEGSGRGGWMLIEWVEGLTVRDVLVKGAKRKGEEWERGVQNLMGRIGRAIGKLHQIGVVHGDLTTSNLMLRPEKKDNGDEVLKNGEGGLAFDLDGEIVLIDFGLSAQNIHDEDKAVDLYVLERAFGSTHPEAENGFQEVLRAYGQSSGGAKVVLKRLEDVKMRGRKKSMLG